jgi:hypothetical protein
MRVSMRSDGPPAVEIYANGDKTAFANSTSLSYYLALFSMQRNISMF